MTWRIFSGTFSQFLIPTHGFDFLIGGWVVFGVLALACLVVAAGGRRGDGLVLASAVAPMFLSAGVSTIQPIWIHRYFVFAHLFLLTALAIGDLEAHAPRGRRCGRCSSRPCSRSSLVANVKFWEYLDIPNKTGMRGAVETILARRRGDEMIVTFDHHQYFPLKFYAGRRGDRPARSRPARACSGAGT